MDKVICKGCKADITDCWKFVKMGVIDGDSRPDYGSGDTVWVYYEFECPYCEELVFLGKAIHGYQPLSPCEYRSGLLHQTRLPQ
jgi:hypothetical protein